MRTRLHPVEAAYLHGGADLAILVAGIGLLDHGAWGHPLERAVASVQAEGATGAMFWIRMRATPALEAVRVHLVDHGLLRDRSGLGALRAKPRTRAGDHALAEARAAAIGRIELVATRGLEEARALDPGLGEVIDQLPRPVSRPPRRGPLTPAAVVDRSMKRNSWRRRGPHDPADRGSCGGGGYV